MPVLTTTGPSRERGEKERKKERKERGKIEEALGSRSN
jgi:hypothetical protein